MDIVYGFLGLRFWGLFLDDGRRGLGDRRSDRRRRRRGRGLGIVALEAVIFGGRGRSGPERTVEPIWHPLLHHGQME